MKKILVLVLCLLPAAHGAWGQSPSGASVWDVLAQPAMDPAKSAAADNVEIVRDRIHIKLVSGTIQFAQPANGVTFAAVFHGQGHIELTPPNPLEAQQLSLFTKQIKISYAFTDATFSFTDGLLEEVEKQVKWKPAGGGGDDLYTNRQREREDLGQSALPRMLQGVLATDKKRTAFFLADLKLGGKDWVQFRDDALDPEEIRVGRWVDVGPYRTFDIWMEFPAGGDDGSASLGKSASQRGFRHWWPDHQRQRDRGSGPERDHADRNRSATGWPACVDLRFRFQSARGFRQGCPGERSALLPGAGAEGSQSIVRRLFGGGTERSAEGWRQPDAGISLWGQARRPPAGNGNYFCESSGWYPERPNSFSTKTNFDITFRSPKNSTLVATGIKTSETVDGSTRITTWKSEVPLAVAGFAYGDYKIYDDKAGDVAVSIYANREPDETLQAVQHLFDSGQVMGAVGQLTPSSMAKTMGIEMSNTVRLFSNFFGPYPYKTLSVTSLPISYSYGQGWPGLIYLWSASFLDPTQRHEIGLKDGVQISDFFRAHESSHQWWGHKVGWKSYHDQWLSEGFAEFSGNLYVQYRDNMKEYVSRWRHERELLAIKDYRGHTVESLGPIWMGQRIASSETGGGSYQDLIYSKGGYVLHMLRMQLWDSRNPDPDHLFKAMMQDYCNTYNNKAASTEDFKAIVEKHMTRTMDLDSNHKMDWFFKEYVYGTGIPTYSFHASVTPAADGKTSISAELTRSGVPADWKDVVPLYAHVGDKVIRLGAISSTHPVEQINVVVAQKIDKVTVNEYEDNLADFK